VGFDGARLTSQAELKLNPPGRFPELREEPKKKPGECRA
jgi:hypothetical protein